MFKENKLLLILDIYGNQHVKEFPSDLDELVIGEDSGHYQSLYKVSSDLKTLNDINEELSEYFISKYSDNSHIYSNPPPFIMVSDAWASHINI